jgi:glycosyltransferase involved in cell wall biosynthesis
MAQIESREVFRNPALCGIIIPVYNSPQYLGELLERISEVRGKEANWHFSILIVDDGSQPPVPPYSVKGLAIAQIRNEQNRGKGAALKRGFTHFLQKKEIEAVITLDSDLQHPPEYIPAFLRTLEKDGEEVIVGCRQRDPKVMPFHRILSNRLTTLIISAMIGQKVGDSQCGFRLYSRRVLESISLSETRFHLESEFLIRSGWKKFRIGCVPIPTIYNDAPSAIRNIPDTLNFISLIFRLSIERIRGHV